MIDFILDLLPNSDYFYLIYLGAFFLITSLFVLYLAKKYDKPQIKKELPKAKELTLDDLIKMVSSPKATPSDLLVALQLYHEKYRVENDVGKSMEFFKKALNHKSKTKALFDYFHGTILAANLKYKDQLDKLEREALNSP